MSSCKNTARRWIKQGRPILLSQETACASCLSRISHRSRRYATTATAAVAEAPQPPVPQNAAPVDPATGTAPGIAYRLLASPVVSRPPLLTRDLTPFEKSFYLYQKRLNERLALPFSRYFYYKRGTPGDVEWKRKARTRKSAARDIGQYSGYGDEAWNDEVLVGDTTAEPSSIVEALIRDAEGKDLENSLLGDAERGANTSTEDATKAAGAEVTLAQDVAIQRPLPRRTKADEEGDVRSLNRKLDRTLYLLVQNKDGRWRFPEDKLRGKESLHQAAERTLTQSLGLNMHTWIVGNHPVGHHSFDFLKPRRTAAVDASQPAQGVTSAVEREECGEKVFFMKARIMAGKPDMSKNEYGDKDYRWLAKEEIAKLVGEKYWSSIRNMLAER